MDNILEMKSLEVHYIMPKCSGRLSGIIEEVNAGEDPIREYTMTTYVNPVWSAEFSLASSTYLRGGILAGFLKSFKDKCQFARIVWY